MKKRTIIAALLLSMAVVIQPQPIFAESALDFDAIKCLNTAAEKYGTILPGCTKQDCTAFARYCVENAGVPTDEDRPYNYQVGDYKDYLLNNGYAVLNKLVTRKTSYIDKSGKTAYSHYIPVDENADKVAPGDIFLYKCDKCGKYFHMSICRGPAEGKEFYRYYQQNPKQDGSKLALKIGHGVCGATAAGTSMYALHITSADNGFTDYPETVNGFKAKLSAYNKVRLSWDSAVGAVKYNVFRAYNNTFAFEKVATVTGTTYVETVPASKLGYKTKFFVRPVNSEGRVGAASEKVVEQTLKKMTKPTVVKYSAGKIKIKWQNINNETGYQFSKSTKKAGTKIICTFPTTKGNAKVFKVKKKVNYYYKIRAYKTVDDKKLFTPWSAARAYKLK